jgi:hypothetical protein
MKMVICNRVKRGAQKLRLGNELTSVKTPFWSGIFDSGGRGWPFSAGTTKITCGDLAALRINQEASSRLRRDGFVLSSAWENKFSPLPKKQNPQLSLRASCWSGRQDSNLRPLAPHASALPGCATSRNLSFGGGQR